MVWGGSIPPYTTKRENMALTDISNHIQGITGVGTANTDFIESAQRFVVSKIPKELLRWATADTNSAVHGGDSSPDAVTMPVGTDNILAVRRGLYFCEEVGLEQRAFIEPSSGSLLLPTAVHPKYYIAAGHQVS